MNQLPPGGAANPPRPARRLVPRGRWLWATPLVVGILVAAYFKLPALGYHWFRTSSNSAQWQQGALWLPDYRVTVEALPIDGLTRNLSGLTFNTETGTLFAIINRPPQIAELTTAGRLLRIVDIEGARDPEDLAHVQGNTYVVVDELSQSLYWVQIGPASRRISTAGAPMLRLGVGDAHNMGFEGVCWDRRHARMFVVKEKLPLSVLVVRGLDGTGPPAGAAVEIGEWKSWHDASLFMSDLSAITVHEPTGHVLLLSDESALLVEYTADGQPVSILPLWRGFHGLQRKVPQPEGVAVGPDGTIYLVSEPNLFYRFERVSVQK